MLDLVFSLIVWSSTSCTRELHLGDRRFLKVIMPFLNNKYGANVMTKD